MEQRVKTLLTSLYSGKISKEQFIESYFENKNSNNEFVLEFMAKGMVDKSDETIEEVIVLLSTGFFPISVFVSNLRILLLESWHTRHEDVVTLLTGFSDDSTIEHLYKATELKLSYLDYDDTYQLARKCIKSLSRIGNDLSLNKIRCLMNSGNDVIAGYARKELVHKGLL